MRPFGSKGVKPLQRWRKTVALYEEGFPPFMIREILGISWSLYYRTISNYGGYSEKTKRLHELNKGNIVY